MVATVFATDTEVCLRSWGDGKRTPCQWTLECPINRYGMEVECSDCPASSKEADTPMTWADAADWWRRQSLD